MYRTIPYADNSVIFQESQEWPPHGFSGPQSWLWWWGRKPSLTATSPLLLQQFSTIREEKKSREKEPKISQLVSARTYQFQVTFLQHPCHGVSTSCQYEEERSFFDRSHVYIPDPLQQESLFPLNELPLPQLGPTAVERHPLLEKFSGSKPRRGCVSACHIYLQDRLAIFIIRGRAKEGQTGRNTACLPRRCHLSFHILIM